MDASVRALLNSLRDERLSVSFEVVARCLPDHGQRPHGEYLVVTSVARHCADGTVEVRTRAHRRDARSFETCWPHPASEAAAHGQQRLMIMPHLLNTTPCRHLTSESALL